MSCQTVDFTIRKGDVLPLIEATLYNNVAGADTIADLTTATLIEFLIKPVLGGALVTRTGSIVGAATLGKVRYSWVSGDTSVAGDFHAYWRVTYPGPKLTTYPNKTYLLVQVVESL